MIISENIVKLKNIYQLSTVIKSSIYVAINIEIYFANGNYKGEIIKVEGIIEQVITGLSQDQDQCLKLKDLPAPFTLILDDVSCDALIENPNAHMS